MRINPYNSSVNYAKIQQKINHKQDRDRQEDNSDSSFVSQQAKAMSKLSKIPESRQEKIRLIKQMIAEGQYLSKEKIRNSIKRMLIEIFY